MKWQPIETAPKDGTPILATWFPWTVDGWLHEERLPITVRWRDFHPNAKGKAEFRDGNGHRRPYITHWMPLPKESTQHAKEESTRTTTKTRRRTR